jgi:hypothetical protein
MALTDNLISCWNTRQNLWDAVSHYNAYGKNPDYQLISSGKYLFRRATATAGNNLEFDVKYYCHSVFTVSFDCITTETDSNRITIEHGEAGQSGYCFHVHAAGCEFITHVGGNNYFYSLTFTVDSSIHRYLYAVNMVAGVGGTIDVYQDGVLKGQKTTSEWTAPATSSAFHCFIGGRTNLGWHGSLGRIRYWDRALIAAEALADVTFEYAWRPPAKATSPKTPVTIWRCDEGSGTTLYDTQGPNNLVASTTLNWVTGQGQRVYAYDPYAVSCPTQNVTLGLTNKISVCLWTKTKYDSGRSDLGALFRFNDNSHMRINNNEYVENYKCYMDWCVGEYSSTNMSQDEWNHVAIVIGDGSYQWFINGYTGPSGSLTVDLSSVAQISFGSYSGFNPYLAYINDMRIFNDVITQGDVMLAMNWPINTALCGPKKFYY